MRVAQTTQELADELKGSRPAFVPTMGALHGGHLALISRAKQLARNGTRVAVSIFVNPTQFGPGEDYQRYPRMLEADATAAGLAGADVIFAPSVETVYPQQRRDLARVPRLPEVATQPKLEDAHRPGHFAGVCQVVARLFDMVGPSVAVFGEKDYQQLRVIEEMVKQETDRWPGLKIERHPTVREPDGLAMSSRNAYLHQEQRADALAISRALMLARNANSPREAEQNMQEILQWHRLAVDYAVVRDARTLMPIEEFGVPARALIAARLVNVRLIDNMAAGGGETKDPHAGS
ncbi:MAG: pantoate--beta-alanine ligase [Phycisphaerales bacterium]|nr:pantoate--beta-alanine ligase [Phycisphaerales bacterium]